MPSEGSVAVLPLRETDRARWDVLARGYKTFYETLLADADYDRTWTHLLQGEDIHGLGAHVDGVLVGIAHYLFHANVWTPHVCYLQDLFVDARVRGRGTARALIDAVAAQARVRDAARLYWMTRHDNAVARALYDKVGSYRGFIRYEYPLA